jgi:light-regulated signal transduction histidine kinase (bacteriophytochrome)
VDLTELKQAEEKRIQAEETLSRKSVELESANRELEAFSYSVSHDLRAPLRAIDGFTRMLLKAADKLDDDERRRFEVIRENTRKMGKLIEDLLAFSRLGRQPLSVSGINVTDLVNEVWGELLAANPDRRMSLVMDTLPVAFGDGTLIRQVFVNLLSNAVKFTRKREAAVIEIGAKTADSEIVYSVRDNGTGFDMDYYDKLFGVFQRLHTQEEYEGSGAGLAIVKRIVTRHGGRVWAEGKVDQGAAFFFSLPDR